MLEMRTFPQNSDAVAVALVWEDADGRWAAFRLPPAPYTSVVCWTAVLVYLVKNKERISTHSSPPFLFFPITNEAPFIGWRRSRGRERWIKVLSDLNSIPTPHFLPLRLIWRHTSVIATILRQDRKQRRGNYLGASNLKSFNWQSGASNPLTPITTTPSFLHAE